MSHINPTSSIENFSTTGEATAFQASTSGIADDVEKALRCSYDYIVVGGGTAGLTVASRLAENPNITVCVIEAGESRSDPLIEVPGMYGYAIRKEGYDWSFDTVKQPALNDRSIPVSAGKVLGGSSAINFLVRMRASSVEYDAWAQFGEGWNWNNLLPYFKKSEHYVAPKKGTDQIFPGITEQQDEESRRLESKFCGHVGPVQRTYNEIYTDVLEPYVQTLNSLGIKTNRSPDYGNSTGVFNIGTAVNRSTGKRSYAANAYLTPEGKSNLVVLTGCTVTKVCFDKITSTEVKAVTGVEFVKSGSDMPNTLNANKEVIISAGSYNTPKILELSGIGGKNLLDRLKIPCIIDLPGVGENLQEHIIAPSDFIVNDGVFTMDKLRNDPEYEAEQRLQYTRTKDGAYATTVSAYGFIKLHQIVSGDELKKMEAELDKTIAATTSEFYKKQYEQQKKYLGDDRVGDVEIIMVPRVFVTSPPAADTSYIGMTVGTPRSHSRGSVHISSNRPRDPPVIDPQYMKNPFDLECLLKGSMFIRKVSETQPLKSKIKQASTPPPSTEAESQFEEFLRSYVRSTQHPIGTAAMAPRDIGGVVDCKLLVYGTKNLRVVDMSIAPIHIAAHLLDTAYAIGEKAHDLIAGNENDL